MPKELFVGQLVIYYHPDEPEGWMAGTITSIKPPEPEDTGYNQAWGRGLMLELHNWGDKSAVESEVFPIYNKDGQPLRIEDISGAWDAWYEEAYGE